MTRLDRYMFRIVKWNDLIHERDTGWVDVTWYFKTYNSLRIPDINHQLVIV